jgi:hypothetical protein
MKKWLPVATTVAITIGTAVFSPQFVAAHPIIFAVGNALAMVLHAVLPSTVYTIPT